MPSKLVSGSNIQVALDSTMLDGPSVERNIYIPYVDRALEAMLQSRDQGKDEIILHGGKVLTADPNDGIDRRGYPY